MSSFVTFTQPLAAGASVASPATPVTRAVSITGTAFADQNGTAYVEQSGDGTHWDYSTAIPVTAGVGAPIDVDILDDFARVRYVNGGTDQTVFRLFTDLRDPYGSFLAAAEAPSPGGAFAILFWQQASGSYTYVGRFDGADAWNAITNAAVYTGKSGKYAAFAVGVAVVSNEVIQQSTTHSAGSF